MNQLLLSEFYLISNQGFVQATHKRKYMSFLT